MMIVCEGSTAELCKRKRFCECTQMRSHLTTVYILLLCVFFVFSSLLCRVSMDVSVLVDFIFCSYLMGSCQCFVAFLSSSLWIATACDCWLLEQNKTNERTNVQGHELGDANCCAYVHVFTDASVTVDVSANARRCFREHVCKLILSVHGGLERYLALSCRHL